MKEWNQSEEWKRQCGTFCVVVKHWKSLGAGDGDNRWNVYAYIYPKHQLFTKFTDTGMYDDACYGLPMHGGVTLLKRYIGEKGDVASIQIGCDYNHDGDSRYTHYETKDQACSVFNDAEELVGYLKDKDIVDQPIEK